ncbi:MAG: DUF1552 domain-containing protein [Acidobacteriota bacterium]|nr:DUF1552 domain-containing protein [Acidobacteriota bacterium]
MRIIRKVSLPRRTFLRGLGAAIGLPLLDSMAPALSPGRAGANPPADRLGVVYVPHGAVMENWTPAAGGAEFELTPILQPLTPFRDRLLVLTGLSNEPAVSLPGEPAGGHGRIGGAFLTGVHVKPTEGAGVEAGVSFDQIAAAQYGKHTQLASLELALEATGLSGACDVGYSCAYINTLSWRNSTTPLPTENNPRAVFERLFGDQESTDPAERLRRIRSKRSILDSVTRKAARLQARIGAGDRNKIVEYLDAVRDVERRIQIAETQAGRQAAVLERPAGIPGSFEEHAKLMIDLQVLAYQSDLTRVITFMMGRELSQRTYPEIGVPDPHHPLSHHQYDPEKLEKLTRVSILHMRMFAYFLQKLRSTPEGNGSLLDQVTLLYGSGMSDSDLHTPRNLPILVAGGGAGRLKGGRHVRFQKGTPLTNLYMTVLSQLGVPAERIGDSTGQVEFLSDV